MTAPSLKDRVALITGATRGIGRAVAVEAARRGAHVIGIGRKEADLAKIDDAIRDASGRQASLVPLDLTDFEGIERLAGVIAHRWGRLDLLVANAGLLGTLTPLAQQTPKEFDKVLSVNLTANHRLVRAFDGLLRKAAADHGRADAIFLSSGVAVRPRGYWGAYQASKAGLAAMATGYGEEVESAGVRVHVFDPGAAATAMRAAAYPGEDASTLPSAEDAATRLFQLVGR